MVVIVIFVVYILQHNMGIDVLNIQVLPWNECLGMLLMVSQHWSR